MFRVARVLLLVLVGATAVLAADSPFAGTWKLNPAKREFTGATIAFEQAAGGGMKMTADVKFDGKDYPASGPTIPAAFTLALKRVDARSFEMTQKVGGKVVYRDTMTVSADGKTLTDVGVAEGTQEKTKAVYDRQ